MPSFGEQILHRRVSEDDDELGARGGDFGAGEWLARVALFVGVRSAAAGSG